MPSLLIENARVIDPSTQRDGMASILLADGRVAFVGEAAEARQLAGPGSQAIDAAGCVAAPGFIDMHAHLREPGGEAEETIVSGARAAASGGFASVACMPNTNPPLDSEGTIAHVLREAKNACGVRVFPVGAITAGLQGKSLSEMGLMARMGAVAFSDDGLAVPTPSLLKNAFYYANMLDMPLLEHCEDADLKGGGQMNHGALAVRLGLPGIPNAVEEVCVARDIILAGFTGAKLHVQHVSTAGSVELIAWAKEKGIRVTAEATPHHLTLTEERVAGYDPVFKVAPPLRTETDRRAVAEALAKGIVDAIATDHAPHVAEEKEGEFSAAANGMIGLETAVAVILTHLVRPGHLSWNRMVDAFSCQPARILGLKGLGTLAAGAMADVTLIDPDCAWTADPAKYFSRSRNCPYAGNPLTGRVKWTIVDGVIVHGAKAGE